MDKDNITKVIFSLIDTMQMLVTLKGEEESPEIRSELGKALERMEDSKEILKKVHRNEIDRLMR